MSSIARHPYLLLSLFFAGGCGADSSSKAFKGAPEGYKLPMPDSRPVQKEDDLVLQMVILRFDSRVLVGKYPGGSPKTVYFAELGETGEGLVEDMERRHPKSNPKLVWMGPRVRFLKDGTCLYKIRFKNAYSVVMKGYELGADYAFKVNVQRDFVHYDWWRHFQNERGEISKYTDHPLADQHRQRDFRLSERLGLSSLAHGAGGQDQQDVLFAAITLEPKNSDNAGLPQGEALGSVDLKTPKPDKVPERLPGAGVIPIERQ